MRVAVIIPNRNYGHLLGRALDSVASQTVRADEVIVVDGRSSDNSFDVSLAHGATWIESIPLGMANARNVGIRQTSAELIIPLDADDWIEPTFIEKCLELFQESWKMNCFPPVGAVATQLRWPNGTISSPKPPFTVEHFLECNLLFTCSMFLRQCWEEVGGYNEYPKLFEDWHFWANVAAREYKIWQVDEPLFHYCPHAGSSSAIMASEEDLYRRNTINAIHRSVSTARA